MDMNADLSLTWYVARGSGMVAYLLLTGAVVLGIALNRRALGRRVPRLLLDSAHRWLTLGFFLFVMVHAGTLLLDPFTRFRLRDIVVPFASDYRPLWLSLGIIAVELDVALGASVLVRRWIGYRAWHALHGLTYLLFPLALLHGLGTGSDTRTSWATGIYVGSAILVIAAIAWRARGLARWGRPAVGAASLVAVGVLLWAVSGPYAPGWAAAAGTPQRLLGRVAGQAVSQAASPVSVPSLPSNLEVRISGQTLTAAGRREVLLRGSGTGTMPLEVAIALSPEQGGGAIQLRTADQVPLCAGEIVRGAGDEEPLVATCAGYGRATQLVVTFDRLDRHGFSGVLRAGSGPILVAEAQVDDDERADEHADADEREDAHEHED
ncbi:MAG: ferric reductase-like transmembrane domain-containing protein [Sphaerobacter sp.]|nr:ferric reductase-like transmembrane domain-containing protein [Sphaerobacter sp.]